MNGHRQCQYWIQLWNDSLVSTYFNWQSVCKIGACSVFIRIDQYFQFTHTAHTTLHLIGWPSLTSFWLLLQIFFFFSKNALKWINYFVRITIESICRRSFYHSLEKKKCTTMSTDLAEWRYMKSTNASLLLQKSLDRTTELNLVQTLSW